MKFLDGIKFYVPKGVDDPFKVLSSYHSLLNRFINVLKDLVKVFELAPNFVHVFYDNNTNSIAFNDKRLLFFNFKFYHELHADESSIKYKIDAITYWYMIFCHELAHNFIQDHDSKHEVSIILKIFFYIDFNSL